MWCDWQPRAGARINKMALTPNLWSRRVSVTPHWCWNPWGRRQAHERARKGRSWLSWWPIWRSCGGNRRGAPPAGRAAASNWANLVMLLWTPPRHLGSRRWWTRCVIVNKHVSCILNSACLPWVCSALVTTNFWFDKSKVWMKPYPSAFVIGIRMLRWGDWLNY